MTWQVGKGGQWVASREVTRWERCKATEVGRLR